MAKRVPTVLTDALSDATRIARIRRLPEKSRYVVDLVIAALEEAAQRERQARRGRR